MFTRPRYDAPVDESDSAAPPDRGSVGEVARAFLKLGLTSFGGPTAHLGFFRTEFVERRRWLSDAEYADTVALAQLLPGPASSQVGFALGLRRAGALGALAAFVAFTLPSAVLMVAVAAGASWLSEGPGAGVLLGLRVVAVAVVALAVLGMAASLASGAVRALVAVAALGLALLVGGAAGQLGALLLGAVVGLVALRGAGAEPAPAASAPGVGVRVSRRVAVGALGVLTLLLVGVPLAAAFWPSGALEVTAAFSRAGALVFGGGHVVLPLLEAAVVAPGWVSEGQFLTGYGAAQAVPGPLFSFAAFLGAAAVPGPAGWAVAALAVGAIFLPGFLLLVGVLPFWEALRRRAAVRAALRGVGAAVVGILAAALYDPVFVSAVSGPAELVLAAVCFVLLGPLRLPPVLVVLVGAAAGPLLPLLA